MLSETMISKGIICNLTRSHQSKSYAIDVSDTMILAFESNNSWLTKTKVKERLKYLLMYLIEIHMLTPKTCDQAVMEFNNFI